MNKAKFRSILTHIFKEVFLFLVLDLGFQSQILSLKLSFDFDLKVIICIFSRTNVRTMTKPHVNFSCIFVNTGHIKLLCLLNHGRLIKSLLIEFNFLAVTFYSFLFNDSSNFLKIPWEENVSCKR